jgi:hypothetical protein
MSALTYAVFRSVNPANTAKNKRNEENRWYPQGKTIF